jgi:hypothetical protein
MRRVDVGNVARMECSVIRGLPFNPAMSQQQAASLIPDYAALDPGYGLRQAETPP